MGISPIAKLPAPKVHIRELRNLITNKDLAKTTSLEFLEYSESGMVLGMPGIECGVGNSLQLLMIVETSVRTIVFNCTAKVIAKELGDDGRARVTLRNVQYENSEWQDIQNALSDRQRKFAEMFSRMKE